MHFEVDQKFKALGSLAAIAFVGYTIMYGNSLRTETVEDLRSNWPRLELLSKKLISNHKNEQTAFLLETEHYYFTLTNPDTALLITSKGSSRGQDYAKIENGKVTEGEMLLVSPALLELKAARPELFR